MTANNPFYTGPNAPTPTANQFYAPTGSNNAASKLTNPNQQQPTNVGFLGIGAGTDYLGNALAGNPDTGAPTTVQAGGGYSIAAPTPSPGVNTNPYATAPLLSINGADSAQYSGQSGGPANTNVAASLRMPDQSTGTQGSTGPLSGPGYGELWYQQHGNDLNGPTNSQTLFDEGMAGSNPFYQDAIAETNKGINAAENSRGNWNSSAALGSIGMADANLLGQQALGLTTLGGTADTQNTNQYLAESAASNAAQNSTQNRIAGDITANMNLSTAQSNLVDNFSQMAQTGQLTTDMAGIEAQLQASGVDAATAQALANDILTAAGVVTKATAGK